ncbi:hypothetical protein D9M70_531950 [compost metagenome]
MRIERHRAAGNARLDIELVAVVQKMSVLVEGVPTDQTFLPGQALKEVEMRVPSLHAVFARQVFSMQVLLVVEDAVFLEHGLENVRHALLLEPPPVGAELESGQLGLDYDAIAGAHETGGTLREAGHHPVHMTHSASALPDGQQRRLVEHLVEVNAALVAGELDGQSIGLAEGFFQGEFDDFEFGWAGEYGKGEPQIPLAHGTFLVEV